MHVLIFKPMQKRCLFAAGLLFLFVTIAVSPYQQTAAERERAETLLHRMTLDEKIGQMTQVTLGVICTPEDGVLDAAALKKAIEDYKVGSILNVTNHALTVDQWRKVQTGIQDEAKRSRLQIPVIYGLDGIH